MKKMKANVAALSLPVFRLCKILEYLIFLAIVLFFFLRSSDLPKINLGGF